MQPELEVMILHVNGLATMDLLSMPNALAETLWDMLHEYWAIRAQIDR